MHAGAIVVLASLALLVLFPLAAAWWLREPLGETDRESEPGNSGNLIKFPSRQQAASQDRPHKEIDAA
jgi:hypothetical protein